MLHEEGLDNVFPATTLAGWSDRRAVRLGAGDSSVATFEILLAAKHHRAA